MEPLRQVRDERAAVIGGRESAHVATGAEAAAVAHEQDGARPFRIERGEGLDREWERLPVQRGVAAAADLDPQHPPLVDHGIAHARARSLGSTSSLNWVRKRSWSWPGPWNTRWLSPAST